MSVKPQTNKCSGRAGAVASAPSTYINMAHMPQSHNPLIHISSWQRRGNGNISLLALKNVLWPDERQGGRQRHVIALLVEGGEGRKEGGKEERKRERERERKKERERKREREREREGGAEEATALRVSVCLWM